MTISKPFKVFWSSSKISNAAGRKKVKFPEKRFDIRDIFKIFGRENKEDGNNPRIEFCEKFNSSNDCKFWKESAWIIPLKLYPWSEIFITLFEYEQIIPYL